MECQAIFFKSFTVCRKVENFTLVIFFKLFIKVPGADTAAIAAIAAAALTNGGRLCGRALSSASGSLTNGASIVTGTVCGKFAIQTKDFSTC